MTILIYNCGESKTGGVQLHVHTWRERRQLIVMKAKNAKKKWQRISSLLLFYGSKSVPLCCVADNDDHFLREMWKTREGPPLTNASPTQEKNAMEKNCRTVKTRPAAAPETSELRCRICEKLRPFRGPA